MKSAKKNSLEFQSVYHKIFRSPPPTHKKTLKKQKTQAFLYVG